jgi:Rhodopirellula transposase DDE domain
LQTDIETAISTTTNEGLRIKAAIDENTFAAGIKVTDEGLAALVIGRDAFHGEWNCRLKPDGPLS